MEKIPVPNYQTPFLDLDKVLNGDQFKICESKQVDSFTPDTFLEGNIFLVMNATSSSISFKIIPNKEPEHLINHRAIKLSLEFLQGQYGCIFEKITQSKQINSTIKKINRLLASQ